MLRIEPSRMGHQDARPSSVQPYTTGSDGPRIPPPSGSPLREAMPLHRFFLFMESSAAAGMNPTCFDPEPYLSYAVLAVRHTPTGLTG